MKKRITFAALLALASCSAAWAETVVRTPAETQHDMVLVPAGGFLMGRDLHTVFLDGYYIDKYPVTNALWNAFAHAEGRDVRLAEPWADADADVDRLPARQTWFDARDYCAWAGLRLPTEAEWEKAGRGTDGRMYPWGQQIDHSKASYDKDPVMPVGSWPDNVSPFGVHDMSGNLWEWANDWFADDYYLNTPLFNPPGPARGTLRILKGGGNLTSEVGMFLASRFHSAEPTVPYCQFRCARSVDGQAIYPSQIAITLQADAGHVNQPLPLVLDVQLDRTLARVEQFDGMSLDLSSAQIQTPLPLIDEGNGRYSTSSTITPLRNGRHPLVVQVQNVDGTQYPTGRVLLDVWPVSDVGIFADRLSTSWTLSHRNMESVALDQTDLVYAGHAAGSMQAKRSFAGWQVLFETTQPLDAFGYAVRVAVNPAQLQLQDGDRLSLSVVPGSGVSLLDHVDLTLRDWQLVEIPLEEFRLRGPLTAISFSGNAAGTFHVDEIQLVVVAPPITTAVVEQHNDTRPAAFDLAQNYPNPFNSNTMIDFSLPTNDHVELAIYNITGQRVTTLIDGSRNAGSYTMAWGGNNADGLPLASGAYFYRLRTGQRLQSRKLLLLR
jgi:formylglycine-generating enzyme